MSSPRPESIELLHLKFNSQNRMICKTEVIDNISLFNKNNSMKSVVIFKG